MATKNFVPRADNEGSLGLADKRWSGAHFVSASIDALSGSMENALTASIAISSSYAVTASYAINAGGGGVINIVDDTTPQLGGNLDLNGFSINNNILSSSVQIASDISGSWSIDRLPSGTVSSSIQIDHNSTTNYDANRHFLQSDITTLGTVTSGNISNILPSGTVSGSSQLGMFITTGSSDLGEQSILGSLRLTGDIIAENYIISSSVSYMTQSYSSGSTIFGDTLDDTHQFTGSVYVTGSVSALDYTGTFIGALSSSAQISSDISGSWNVGRLPANTVSSSIQVDHNSTTNYDVNKHFLQSDITTLGTVTSGNVSAILPTGTVSSSLQFNTQSTPFTGSYTGSFYGDGSNLTGLPGGGIFATTGSIESTTNDLQITGSVAVSGSGLNVIGKLLLKNTPYQYDGTIVIGANNVGSSLAHTSTVNILIGYDARESVYSRDNNVFIGHRAGRYISQSSRNTCIGSLACANQSDAPPTIEDNVCIGYYSGYYLRGSYNVAIGRSTLQLTSVNGYNDFNVAIGYYALFSLQSQDDHNVGVGAWSAYNTQAKYSVFIGSNAGASSGDVGSYKLFIHSANSSTKTDPLIYGEFDNRLLKIYGDHHVSGSLTASGSVIIPSSSTAPTPAVDGMIAYADGVSWNPGGGVGMYAYITGSWHKMT